MLDSQLWRPAPKIAGKGECGRGQRCERGGREWRDEQRILAGYDGSVFPIKSQAGGLQAGDPEVYTVARGGEASGEIELNVGGCLGSGEVRAEDFESDLRLPQRSSEAGLSPARSDRLGIGGEVQAVGATDIAEGVHQDDTVKPCAILGSALDFGLVLFIDFRADQGSRLFQLLNPFFERG